MAGFRIEKDAIGEVEVPSGAYYGSFTTRALGNFSFEGKGAVNEYYAAYVKMKLASAKANAKCGVLEGRKADAIVKACEELLSGKMADALVLDFSQAGAGTPFNMNVNEVVANRANELLGGKKGDYRPVHPNNDVNMGQSSNDLGPTAIRMALLSLSSDLEKDVLAVCRTLDAKAKKYEGELKVGRTHLQDAVPIAISQEILAWSDALKEDLARLRQARSGLCEIPLGGTALGTGITAHPEFADAAAAELSKITGEKLASSKNRPLHISALNSVLFYSAATRGIAISLVKIADDLKLLVSGPKAGIAEVVLPEVEPGSSIMPGKINPSIPEAVEMIAKDAIAADSAVVLGCAGGQLQLNFLTPLVAKNTIAPTISLAHAARMLDRFCLKGMEYDLEACRKNIDATYIFATALNPYLGYQAVAEIVKESLSGGKSVSEVVLLHGLMEKGEIARVLDAKSITAPAPIDTALAAKTKGSEAYRKYLLRIGK